MSFEPQKVFLGIQEFFSIVLPGSVVVYLSKDEVFRVIDSRLLESRDAEYAIVLVFLSYTLGHMLYMAGSWLDKIDSMLRSAAPNGTISRLERGRPPRSKILRKIASWLRYDESALRSAEMLKNSALAGRSPNDSINAFQWAKSKILLSHPHAIDSVYRLESGSKFFRSLLIAMVILAVNSIISGAFIWLIVSLLLIVLSFFRYIGERDRAIKQACWLVLSLETESTTMAKKIKNGRYHQSGGVVYKRINGEIYYLLVTSLKDGTWVLPKGHIESGESKKSAAIREVYEESGVWAKVLQPLDEVEYSKAGKDFSCAYYLMEYIEDGSTGPEPGRNLEWLPFVDAVARPSATQIRDIIAKAHSILG